MAPLIPLLLLLPLNALSHSTSHHSKQHKHHARSACKLAANNEPTPCVLAPESIEGPYYIPHPLLRSNVTEDCEGVSLNLHVSVVDVNTCEPLPGVVVDIWHADAWGEYSGWATHADEGASYELALDEQNDGPPRMPGHGPPRKTPPSETSRWLRGVQETNSSGNISFDTIFPGWYRGRATHIHIRVHAGNVTFEEGVLLDEGRTAHTGQMYFPNDLVTFISESALPYSRRLAAGSADPGPKMNEDDMDFEQGGSLSQMVDIQGNIHEGFQGSIVVGVNPSADHTGDDPFPPGRGGRHGPPRGDKPHGPPPPMPPHRFWLSLAASFVAGMFVVWLAMFLKKWWTRRQQTRQGYIALK